MTIFCFKTLSPTKRLSQLVTEARIEKNLTVAELSTSARVPEKYVTALERADFSSLPPAKTFRLAYIKALAQTLGLPIDQTVTQFITEGGVEELSMVHPRTELPRLPFSSVSIFIRNLVGGLVVLLLIGYLGWQVKRILQPPTLTVYYPLEGAIVNDLSTTIAGQTENESKLTINGQDVMLNNQGRFSVPIDLTAGLNTVVIAAARKHGKTTLITRHLIARPKNTLTLKNNE